MATTIANVVQRPSGQSFSDQENRSVQLDIVDKEQHDLKNTVTDHPVEEGVNISDHVRPEPNRVTMDCSISNNPPPSVGAASPQRGFDAYDQLVTWRDDGTLLNIVTTIDSFSNMVVESISIPRDATNYDGLVFTVTFKKILIVQNQITRVIISKDVRVGNKVHAGAQTPEEDPVEQSDLDAGYVESSKATGALGKSGGFVKGMVNNETGN